jgi:hypothetical protein
MTNLKLPAAPGKDARLPRNPFPLPRFLERRRKSVSACREFENLCREFDNSRRVFGTGCRRFETFCRDFETLCREFGRSCRRFDTLYRDLGRRCREFASHCRDLQPFAAETFTPFQPILPPNHQPRTINHQLL